MLKDFWQKPPLSVRKVLMGAFLDSILIRTNDAGVVQRGVNTIRNLNPCNFWLGPAINGWVSLFPDNNANGAQEDVVIEALAKEAVAVGCVPFQRPRRRHFCTYEFYRGGSLVDRYNSCPSYFDEDARRSRNPSQTHYRETRRCFRICFASPADLEKLNPFSQGE